MSHLNSHPHHPHNANQLPSPAPSPYPAYPDGSDPDAVRAELEAQLLRLSQDLYEMEVCAGEVGAGMEGAVPGYLAKINTAFINLSNLAPQVTDSVPRNVVDHVDRYKNPHQYTKTTLSRATGENQYALGRQLGLESFRRQLQDAVSEAFPGVPLPERRHQPVGEVNEEGEGDTAEATAGGAGVEAGVGDDAMAGGASVGTGGYSPAVAAEPSVDAGRGVDGVDVAAVAEPSTGGELAEAGEVSAGVPGAAPSSEPRAEASAQISDPSGTAPSFQSGAEPSTEAEVTLHGGSDQRALPEAVQPHAADPSIAPDTVELGEVSTGAEGAEPMEVEAAPTEPPAATADPSAEGAESGEIVMEDGTEGAASNASQVNGQAKEQE